MKLFLGVGPILKGWSGKGKHLIFYFWPYKQFIVILQLFNGSFAFSFFVFCQLYMVEWSHMRISL